MILKTSCHQILHDIFIIHRSYPPYYKNFIMGIGNVGIFIYFKIIDFYLSLLMNLFLTIFNIISPFKMTDSDAYKNLNAIGRKRIQVRIENIEDWCIDYTYGNPNL